MPTELIGWLGGFSKLIYVNPLSVIYLAELNKC